MSRTTRLLGLVALGVWAMGIVACGADICAVWSQQQAAGLADEVGVPLWLRLALLGMVGVAPLILVWSFWRTGVWLIAGMQLRSP
ncbi:MAG: hypothetical protein KF889_18330 [Alphaproteobacteria bacterium]|nr:hypothetical protein [Alphaproteobacteria bacterium]MCW5743975.1 hypothetical protein [Alphaproteobacteria bacterium]